MVRVWYEPPPGGPRSHLNRGAYGIESSMEPLFVKKLARMRPVSVIVPAVGFVAFVCYLPLLNPKNMPLTMNPEHQAAQRAYMRYHNMNPISGISSKQARAADPDP
mmetsp:Transcript_37814/g.109108  ORF Transcript_37814/g.109108 Transcript_37814/m.109108 type:complete len:106 (-) Transcript_37814:100-417(-)